MRVLVTGGAGFIGSNIAAALARGGDEVIIADSLAREGSAGNLRALLDDPLTAPSIAFRELDVRDGRACADLLRDEPVDAVGHFAGQVAVTASLADPVADFEVNARGTLNVLEAMRAHRPEAHMLFASTNKVYGSLRNLPVRKEPTRYVLPSFPHGIANDHPADPATPYGCSKLAADAYVRDYAATYGLRATVFRMSCIYGARQHGTADQGWVSWMVRAAMTGAPITIYGDGLQVRDLLHVDDLIELVLKVLRTGTGAGETFNVGGGPAFSMSVWAEFGGLLEDVIGRPVPVTFDERRPGDQDVYVSDIRRTCERLGWAPRTAPADGIAEMARALRPASAVAGLGRS